MKVTCTHCGHQIEISEAIRHQLSATVVAEAKAKAETELSQKFEKDLLFEKEKLAAQVKGEQEEREKLQNELLALTKALADAERKKEAASLELERKLVEKEASVRQEEREKLDTVMKLKILEREKTIDDLKKALEDAQKKAQQGSQQMQGEVLELDIEKVLEREFPQDQIQEVAKGVRGADIIQVVCDKNGHECGTIIWETKNAKWQPSWIEKLKDDQRNAKANIAVLISVSLPPDIHQFALKNGVWVTSPTVYLALAQALRLQLYSVSMAHRSNQNKSERVESLFQYFTSSEFVQRIESIVGSFSAMQKEIETERRWFNLKWERQEKMIRKALDQTNGMYGSLQGALGHQMPELPSSREFSQLSDE